MNILEFLNKSKYTILILSSSIAAIIVCVACKGSVNTPLGVVSFYEEGVISNLFQKQLGEDLSDLDYETTPMLEEIAENDAPINENIETYIEDDNSNISDNTDLHEHDMGDETEASNQISDTTSEENSEETIIESSDEKISEESIVESTNEELEIESGESDTSLKAEVGAIPVNIRANVTDTVWNYTLNETGEYSWLQEFEKGVTPISFYAPDPSGYRYYRDLGIIADNTIADYKVEGQSYFDNTCWIGDSRMVGIYDYCGFNADFYCDNGYCFYSYHLGKPVTYQNERTKVDLNEVLDTHSYSKVYIAMGINDCGYMTTNDIRTYMGELIEKIRTTQPNALIFLVASMHVSKNIEDSKPLYSNRNINSKNVALASYADGNKIYYLDYNYLYTDENGYLNNENTFDGFHLYGKNYEPLIQFFTRHGISYNSN